jgi:hypothetical protein
MKDNGQPAGDTVKRAAKEPPDYGHFVGEVVTKWIANGDGGRDMELVAEFEYVDRDGGVWVAPIGAVVNGASIPRFFWRVVGSPYCGRYRRASVIHDVYCVAKSRPAKDVHKMFYEACRADGVGRSASWVLWCAVRTFGPRW